MTEIPLPVQELKTALIGLSKIAGRTYTLPVLGYVHLERTKAGSITLSAHNLDQAAVVSLDADGKGEPGTMLLPLKELSEVSKRCGRTDTILVQHGENSGVIRYPVGSTMAEQRFDSLPVVEFPPIPQIEGEPIPLPDALKTSLTEALQCASDDETRYVLNGAYLDVSDPKCHSIVGTNGRIMYSANSFSLGLKKSFIIPSHRFLSWKPFLEDGDWSMRMSHGAENTNFEISSLRWRYFSKQIEGNYPNYRQVVPRASDFATTLEFDPATLGELIRIIDRLPCHDPVNRTLQIQVKNQTVTFGGKSANGDTWTNVEVPAVRLRGKDVVIAFNRDFVRRALSFGLNNLQIIDAVAPARFSQDGRQLIVMPIRADSAPPATPPVQKPEAKTRHHNANRKEKDEGPSTEEKPAPAPLAAAEAPTTERINHMKNTQSTAAPTTNGNGSNGHTETTPSLITALEQIEKVKGSYREAIRGLNELTDTLKAVQREQKASEKEVQSVRTTLEKLQSVRL